ncbi:MAG: ABC transporter permease [Sandaracinaceae bacterium]
MRRLLAMFLAVVEKEVRQTARDKMMIGLLVVVPVVQLFVFGHAVNLDVDRVPSVVVDLDRSHSSRTHLRRLFADGTLRLVAAVPDPEEADGYMTRGEAAVVLVIPRDFERDLVRARGTTVQAVVDGSDPNRAGVASAAVSGYFARASAQQIRVQLQQRAALGQPVPRVAETPARSRVLFNPQLETAIYMVPGVAAILLLLITTIVTAMGLARERERGTLEQILVTPVPSAVLIAGKILPFAVFGLVDFGLAMVVGSYGFDMPMRGSFGVLLLATLLYLTATLGMGLLISTLSGSQQQAFMGGFLFMLPAALLSGIMTPVGSMPEWLQPLTLINPVRHYAEVLRAVLLRGAGVADVTLQLVVLAVMGAAVFVFATLRFRSTLR